MFLDFRMRKGLMRFEIESISADETRIIGAVGGKRFSSKLLIVTLINDRWEDELKDSEDFSIERVDKFNKNVYTLAIRPKENIDPIINFGGALYRLFINNYVYSIEPVFFEDIGPRV